jgi:hypothetical protein
MNKYFSRFAVVAVVLASVQCPVATAEDDIEDFASSVNSAWSSTNDAEIQVLVSQRLAEDTNDIVALSVEMYYHLWVDGNISNAQQVAFRLDSIVQASTNQAAREFIAEMRAEVDSVPTTESGPFSLDGLAQLRAESRGIFPSIRRCVWLARTIAEE